MMALIRICIVMALLGLAAIDPIGIVAMPVLLMQKRPLLRSSMFLAGGLTSIMSMGIAFALGLGSRVLAIEQSYPWVTPAAELAAAIILFGIAGYVLHRKVARDTAAELPTQMIHQFRFGSGHVFAVGAALVAIQSLADVVFVVAMIRLGQVHLSLMALVASVGAYAVAALAIQIVIVVLFISTPQVRRAATMDTVRGVLVRYAPYATAGASLLIGGILMIYALLTYMR
jgi:hypothetical protein